MTETDFTARLREASEALDEARERLLSAETALPPSGPDADMLRRELDLLKDVLVDLRLQIDALRVRAS